MPESGTLPGATPQPEAAHAPGPRVPYATVLSNGGLSSLITAAGSGALWAADDALTRWSGDRVEDREGLFVYLRDRDRGTWWSLGHEPVRRAPERYEVSSRPGVFGIARMDDGIEARLDVCVHPSEPLELRRVTLVNHSAVPRRIEVTSYAEVVLHAAAADAGHPAFSKLFVQTESAIDRHALFARRRPRGPEEHHPLMLHALIGATALEHESDRVRFIGRGNDLGAPTAMRSTEALSGTTGNVLDPILSLRTVVTLAPQARSTLAFVTGVAASRERADASLAGLGDDPGFAGAFAQAEAAARDRARTLGMSEVEAERSSRLAAAMLYGERSLRAGAEVVLRAGRAQASSPAPLAPYALLDATRAPAARTPEAVAAHRHRRALGIACDLVIVDGGNGTPIESADDSIRIVPRATLDDAALDTLLANARLVIGDVTPEAPVSMPGTWRTSAHDHAAASQRDASGVAPRVAAPRETLQAFNGVGGFSADGREYVIRLRAGEDPLLPPMPWVNVIANEHFGTIVSERGAGTTWSRNSRERRLSPWSNDPVLDPHGEALYLRDETTFALWSPLPGPCPLPGEHEVRHGFGATVFRHHADALEHETVVFVAPRDPVKLVRVTLTHRGTRPRTLTLTAFQRLVLGALPDARDSDVVTSCDPETRTLLARNRLGGEFGDGIAFATLVADLDDLRYTTDRAAFVGRHGDLRSPAALDPGAELDGRAGACLDPCFATQTRFTLRPGESLTVTVLFGEASSLDEVRRLVRGYREPGAIDRSLADARGHWQSLLAGVQVRTPSPAIDLMVNGWLGYQTLCCRLWGRSAFYQSGGAFGFRDQLQDAASLLAWSPDWLRAQLVLHAGHQFVEGDVLHWWHPPASRGIRTRFADDLLWLPYLLATYLRASGDWAVLDERARYLSAPALEPGQDEVFLTPVDSATDGDLYDHACLALDRSLGVGAHGLPLFGTGDWNDGMNRVGRDGRGESVWMGFFLVLVLGEFLPVCERRDDGARAGRYRAHRERLIVALNDGGWDGGWYRRGYYDDGTPLGSKDSDECRIDALAQAWSVLSGAAPAARAAMAMDAVEERLISERDGLIRLLTPAFEHTTHDPGYIKGYVPGVRENGGQYTHAALWVVRALAELGRNDRAAALLEMLSPVSRTRSAQQVARYQVEPYVVAADVYGEPPHVGRGGWTWYTGSSGWMMRVALESVLGVRCEHGTTLVIRPCVPDAWPRFEVSWRVPGHDTRYDVRVDNPGGCARHVLEARLDGVPVPLEDDAARVPIVRDGRVHVVDVVLG